MAELRRDYQDMQVMYFSAASRRYMPLLSEQGRNFYGGVSARDAFSGVKARLVPALSQ